MIEVMKEVCDELGIEYRPYSGRGMFGKKCFAITVDGSGLSEVADIAYECGRRDGDPYRFSYIKSDSLGLGTVIYWPGIEWEESEEESEEEEGES